MCACLYVCVLFVTQIDSHVFPLYDAFMFYATAINNSLHDGYDIDDGFNISQNYMANMYFNG